MKVELSENIRNSNFPFTAIIDIDDDNITDSIDQWCKNNIGEFYVDWELYGICGWAFKNYDDAIRFVLTWG